MGFIDRLQGNKSRSRRKRVFCLGFFDPASHQVSVEAIFQGDSGHGNARLLRRRDYAGFEFARMTPAPSANRWFDS
jgi:hypothetical protein